MQWQALPDMGYKPPLDSITVSLHVSNRNLTNANLMWNFKVWNNYIEFCTFCTLQLIVAEHIYSAEAANRNVQNKAWL